VIHLTADLRFALKSIEELWIALQFRVRNFDGDLTAGSSIDSPEDRSHSTSGGNSFDPVVIQSIAGTKWDHI
jgi:hypothetical protein